jgi:hypothetical protein
MWLMGIGGSYNLKKNPKKGSRMAKSIITICCPDHHKEVHK